MAQKIRLVQGFKGDIHYTLDFNGSLIDISTATSVFFNYTDRFERKRHSIRCGVGSSQYEAIIPFSKNEETAESGRFYGEFVIKNGPNVDIYPIEDRILVIIRKCI